MLFEGVFAAVPTPFYLDERLYLRKLEHNVARYSRTMLAGLVVLGSTGEAVALDDAESREVLRVAIESASDEKVLVAGVGRESVHATVDLAQYAATLGYDAVLVRNPCYYRPQLTHAALLHYYRMVADRSPLPVLLYSIPRFTAAEIPLEVVAELAQHPNIRGLKESSGSVERIRAVVRATRNAPRHSATVTPVFEAVTARRISRKPTESATFISAKDLISSASSSIGSSTGSSSVATAVAPPAPALRTRTREVGFQVLTGSVANLKESLDAGAGGAVLAFAACAPQACQEIYSAWKEHDEALALNKQQRIAEAAAMIGGQLGIAGLKYACDWNGYYGGRPRAPLLPLTADQQRHIEQLLESIRN